MEMIMKMFRRIERLTLLGALVLTGAACAGESSPEEDSMSLRDELLKGDARVVAGRMFHLGKWVIDGAGDCEKANTAAEKDKCIKYVCDALAPLKPTYVTGLVRLDYDIDKNAPAEIEPKVVEIFKGVKSCIRKEVDHPVKFDVVLNAEHYTADQYKVGTANEGFERLKKMVEKAAVLEPDGYFFDFYSTPWTQENQHPQALKDGIDHLRKKKYFVGGNVWKGKIPDDSDFVAITDDGGREDIERKTAQLKGNGVPILMHIRNDPHKKCTQGVRWMYPHHCQRSSADGERAYRKQILRRHANWQDFGYIYMYPVFFPLAHEPDGSGPLRAYDAKKDGDMLDKIKSYLGPDDHSSKKVAYKGAEDAKPSPYDLGDDGMITIHRGFQGENRQHLYSLSLSELEEATGLTVEMEEYFSLARSPAEGTAPFYRCYMGDGWHVYTTDAGCEGVAGATSEGSIGHIALTQLPGTVPLHRLHHPGTPDEFYTTSAPERDTAMTLGYAHVGIAGYVWDEQGYAVGESPRTPVHRAYHPVNKQHLYTLTIEEITSAKGLTLEHVNAFYLNRQELAGTVPFYRCYLGKGWHVHTTDPGCEGVGGAINEGSFGYIGVTQIEGSTPLYRLFHSQPNDHFYTADAAERDYAKTLGYKDEGVAGYVFTAP
jgi:hypothetical protein